MIYRWTCDAYSQFENGLDTFTTATPRVLYSAKAKKSIAKEIAIPPTYTIQALVRDDRGGNTLSEVTEFAECEAPATDQCCCCLNQCDYDLDGALTVLDLSVLIDVAFAGVPEMHDPQCPTTYGDFDYDGFLTALDVGKFIDHLFAGAPGPCDPCHGIPEESCST